MRNLRDSTCEIQHRTAPPQRLTRPLQFYLSAPAGILGNAHLVRCWREVPCACASCEHECEQEGVFEPEE